MVTYGGMSRKPVTVPTSLLIFKDIELKGFWLSRWAATHSASERQAMLNEIFALIRAEKLRLWMETYDVNKWSEAFRKVRESHRQRKVVLTFNKTKTSQQ
jgi:trans-2-enoyl-CoA reductase